MDYERVVKGLQGFIDEIMLDMDEAADMYREFSEELAENVRTLQIAAQENNLPEVARIVHNIKGISSNYRIDEVYEVSKELDDMLKKGNTVELRESVDKLIVNTEESKILIERFFEKQGAGISK